MNQRANDCAAYFRATSAWRRVFELLLRKYQSYGCAAGTVTLPDATPEECDVMRRLFGRPFSSPLRFRTIDFEAALQETKFRGVTLREVLEAYYNREIRTRRQAHLDSENRMELCLSQAKAGCESTACRAWLDALSHKTGNGYLLLKRSLGPAAEKALDGVCRGSNRLEKRNGRPVRLAVLAAQATSDPHALDAGTLCGDLFLHFLAWRAGCPTPARSEDRDTLFYQSGILNDSIASSVTQVGLLLYTEEGEHPAYRAFRERSEVCTLTLTNLARLMEARSPSGRAYLVENQMVFSQLCDYAPSFRSPLVCTSGQPQVAVLRLLDLLHLSGTELFYSGDFDGKGLSIPSQLLRRYTDRFNLWHMSPEDYRKCLSDKDLTDRSIQLLHGCDPLLAPAVQEILKTKKAGYQELLLSELLKDMTET